MLAYTVDFLCFERKLVVEIDGRQHGWFAGYDRRRTEEIETQGFVVLRFGNEEVLNDLEAVMRAILAASTPGSDRSPSPLAPLPSGRGE